MKWQLGTDFDIKKNMDLVEKRIANIETTTYLFNFQMPTSYYQHKWAIHAFSDLMKNGKVGGLEEKFQMDENNKFGIELEQDGNIVGICLRLVECKHDRMPVWFRFSVLDSQDNKRDSKSKY